MTSITRSYGLGLVFILLVTLIWSLSSMVVQFLYSDKNFDSPFLLTYIGTSLFVLFLPLRLIWERRRRCCPSTSSGIEFENEIIPWNTTDSYEHIPAPSLLLEDDATVTVTVTVEDESRPKVRLLSHRQHFNIAMKIAPIWFLSNFTYNASLKYTSITSSTVLASTGSLFTFLFAIVSRDETFSIIGFLGVTCGVLGSSITGWSDVGNDSDDISSSNSTLVTAGHLHTGTPLHLQANSNPFEGHAFFGDFLGLLSALGYGTYTVMIRVLCPHDENSYSMQLLLGYIGLVNGMLLFPVTIYLMFISPSSTTIANLTWTVFGCLVAKGLLDNVLSDYLWARSVILTSATVATVGLGLTIPLAFFSDWFMGNANVVNIQSLSGALLVLIGFTMVNMGFKSEQHVDGTENVSYDGVHDDCCDCKHVEADD